MKYNMLWTGEFHPQWDALFREQFSVQAEGRNLSGAVADVRLRGAELIDALQGKDIFLIGFDPLTEEVLDACTALKLVMSVRDGPEENIDVAACTRRGIPVMFSAGRCAHSVAETNMCMLLMLAKPVLTVTNLMRSERKWTKENNRLYREYYNSYTELYQKTFSVIGLGRNGKQLALLAHAFGMRVLAYDPYCPPAVAQQYHVELVDMKTAMESADYVSLLARVTPETIGLVGRTELAYMKPSACLINTGRSMLLDEDALFDALEAERIRAAAIDVYPTEPPAADYRGYTIPAEKLILTPHYAGYSLERTAHQYELLWHSYQAFLTGNRGVPLVNPQVFDSPAFSDRGGAIFGAAGK